MPKSITCEVKRQIGWRVMTIAEAVLAREQLGRCIECDQPVRAHKTGTTGKRLILSIARAILDVR